MMTLLALQAATLPMRPVMPWTNSVQVMNCALVQPNGRHTDFVLTLLDDNAFIATGQDAGIKMEVFAPTKSLHFVRRQGMIREVKFEAGDENIFFSAALSELRPSRDICRDCR